MRLKVRFIVTSIGIVATICVFRSLDTQEAPRKTIDTGLHSIVKSSNDNSVYKQKSFIERELERLHLEINYDERNSKKWRWDIASKWVNSKEIYPEYHHDMSLVLSGMANAKIIHADVFPKGTQLKMLLVLDGNQKVVFKQKRYERDFVIEGKPYDGFDRHNGEIASFHLDRVFDFRRSPITLGRVINLRTEILPVASEKLKKTFLTENGNLCYYGYCYYCKEEDKACAKGDEMEGSLTLWLPEEYSQFQKLRHPYQRTYIDGRHATWEVDDNYCENTVKRKPPYNRGRRLLDVADASVFDYLIGNADRHHYEVFKNGGDDAFLIMMDNAKSFGNPYWHEPSILSPIRQCCILRNSTWNRLLQFQNGVLQQLLEGAMAVDPLSPVLHHSHLKAMSERLNHIISAVRHCVDKNGADHVLINSWEGLNRVA